jgi:hypothetical protein
LATAIAAMAVIGFAGAANAFAGPGPVDLRVVDRDTGQPLRLWRHHGRWFVAGEPGERYSLRVTNHTGGRVLVVMSVDGINIYTGETANFDQGGYVLSPYESYDVTGWRKSTSEVAAFAFAPLPQSYAARTGRPADVGVIGMAVFTEKVAVPVPYAAPASRSRGWEDADRGASRYSDTAPARPAPVAPLSAPPPAPAARAARAARAAPPSSSASDAVVTARRTAPAPAAGAVPGALTGGLTAERRDEKLGTAHGAREQSVITLVSFERATPYPQAVRQIEYDTFAHLVASGVIPPPPSGEPRPRPFPAEPDGAGFVPDPPRGP